MPKLDQDEVYEAMLVGPDGAVRIEVGFGFITGYWDAAAGEPSVLFSEPAPRQDLSLIQLTHGGGALELSVVDDNDDAIDVMVFETPAGWDPTQQTVEFRAGATLADNVPGALRVDLVSACQ